MANVEFDSYSDAIPILIIGSPHAACFEAMEPIIENGEGKPIAIKGKLGWSIFGGEPENYPEIANDVQDIISSPSNGKLDLEASREAKENYFAVQQQGNDKISVKNMTLNDENYGKIISSLGPRQHPLIRMHERAIWLWNWFIALLVQFLAGIMLLRSSIIFKTDKVMLKSFRANATLKKKQNLRENQSTKTHCSDLLRNVRDNFVQKFFLSPNLRQEFKSSANEFNAQDIRTHAISQKFNFRFSQYEKWHIIETIDSATKGTSSQMQQKEVALEDARIIKRQGETSRRRDNQTSLYRS